MKQEHSDQLKEISKWYGTFAVAQELAVISRTKCDGDYANNPDAIIHRDTQILEDAVRVMRSSHPLRSV